MFEMRCRQIKGLEETWTALKIDLFAATDRNNKDATAEDGTKPSVFRRLSFWVRRMRKWPALMMASV